MRLNRILFVKVFAAEMIPNYNFRFAQPAYTVAPWQAPAPQPILAARNNQVVPQDQSETRQTQETRPQPMLQLHAPKEAKVAPETSRQEPRPTETEIPFEHVQDSRFEVPVQGFEGELGTEENRPKSEVTAKEEVD